MLPAAGGDTLEQRVFAAIDTLAGALAERAGRFDLLHAQDCIAARAAARVRDSGRPGLRVLRTVHHVDDFSTRALIDCQRQAIVEPDRVLVVSEQWRGILRDEYGRAADVVPNGVDPDRLAAPPADYRAALRALIGATDRFLFLAVGGVEPRKGSVHAFAALARLRRAGVDAMLAVVGGHSFQDYTAYRDAALATLPDLGLALGRDVVLLGTVDERELAGWYHSADALCFPSVKEGWGLAVLEAMCAGLPVIASDLPVFHEYLVHGENALLPPAADDVALAAAMRAVAGDAGLRDRLRAGGAGGGAAVHLGRQRAPAPGDLRRRAARAPAAGPRSAGDEGDLRGAGQGAGHVADPFGGRDQPRQLLPRRLRDPHGDPDRGEPRPVVGPRRLHLQPAQRDPALARAVRHGQREAGGHRAQQQLGGLRSGVRAAGHRLRLVDLELELPGRHHRAQPAVPAGRDAALGFRHVSPPLRSDDRRSNATPVQPGCGTVIREARSSSY